MDKVVQQMPLELLLFQSLETKLDGNDGIDSWSRPAILTRGSHVSNFFWKDKNATYSGGVKGQGTQTIPRIIASNHLETASSWEMLPQLKTYSN